MKYFLCLLLLLPSLTALASDSFTIYLVRHAEKEKDIKDPNLTECGEKRAVQLAELLSTAKINHVYSTNYKRTLATAAPLANQQELAIEQYAPRKLKQFSEQLLAMKSNSLVVGHSNTTPQLTALLSDSQVREISEKEYRGLYLVQINGQTKSFTLLTLPLTCP